MRKIRNVLLGWKGGLSDFLFDRLEPAAASYRKSLKKTVFIGITGSCGKTTTKELTAAVLKSRGPATATRGDRNTLPQFIKTILRTFPFHRAAVFEMAAYGPGTLDRGIAVVAPSIAVVTQVGLDHYSAFRSREAVAAEKSKLVAALPPTGVAVLNADDPFVLAMGEQTQARKILFSASSPDADLWASNIRSPWPERLTFTVHTKDGAFPVETKLCGKHWVTAVLAALGTALALSIPLEDALPPLASLEPPALRMSPLYLGRDITVIRDDCKAPYLSVPSCLEFLAEARAKRKILILGTLSDYPGDSSSKYKAVVREGLKAVDEIYMVGPLRTSTPEKFRNTAFGGRVRGFDGLPSLARHLGETAGPGDLILVKGSEDADRLHRLVDILKQRFPS